MASLGELRTLNLNHNRIISITPLRLLRELRRIDLSNNLKQQIKKTIRKNASPRHVPAKIIAVPDIPKTLSGKIAEIAVRDMVQGQTVNNAEALANPQALHYFKNRIELLR